MNEVVDKLPGQKCPLLFALRTKRQEHNKDIYIQRVMERLDLPLLASTTAFNCQSFRGGGSLSCFPTHLGLMTKNSACCVEQQGGFQCSTPKIFPGQPLATTSASTCQESTSPAQTSANKPSQTATAKSEHIINGKGALNSSFLTRRRLLSSDLISLLNCIVKKKLHVKTM